MESSVIYVPSPILQHDKLQGPFGYGKGKGPEFFESQRRGDQNFFLQFFLRLRHNSYLNTLLKNFSRLRRNLSLYHTSCHITCSYIIRIFLNPPGHSLFNLITAPLHRLYEVDVLSPWGWTRISSQGQRGGDQIFFL